MKALSIKQPWAAAIIYGGKDIENRKWTTPLRGEILIHAGQTFDDKAPADLMRWYWELPREQRERGGIIGRVEIKDVIKTSESKWFQGPFGFVLSGAKELPFRKVRGQLRFFEVRPDGD